MAGDGRQFPVPLPVNNDIASLLDASGSIASEPQLEALKRSTAREQYAPTHADEVKQVAEIRAHRFEVEGRTYKIVRGDLHRHTEISMDGATDGSLYVRSLPLRP